jgi:hypothetical protein
MATTPLTATAEATQFPQGWDIYWSLRTYPNQFSIYEACKAMCEAQYEGWTENLYLNPAILKGLRKLEVMTSMYDHCECPPCMNGDTDHKPPFVIAPISKP